MRCTISVQWRTPSTIPHTIASPRGLEVNGKSLSSRSLPPRAAKGIRPDLHCMACAHPQSICVPPKGGGRGGGGGRARGARGGGTRRGHETLKMEKGTVVPRFTSAASAPSCPLHCLGLHFRSFPNEEDLNDPPPPISGVGCPKQKKGFRRYLFQYWSGYKRHDS